MESEVDCKCLKVSGHLEDVKWLLWPRCYKSSPGLLCMGDWTKDPHIWLHYVESADGVLADDDVLVSTDSRYWSIHDVQRYFVSDLHCEKVLFTCQYPNLRLPTRHGCSLWKTNAATKLTSSAYQRNFARSLEVTLKKMEARQVQMNRLIVCDHFIHIDQLDYFKRKMFFKHLLNIIRFDASLNYAGTTHEDRDKYTGGLNKDCLQLVSFENLRCKRLEGVTLIQQLACFNAHTLKYLFLWRFVLPDENPLLINYSYITGSGQYIPRPESRQCFLRSLGELRNLRLLAIEYSQIADSTGGALISLMPILKRPHFRLQVMCREEQTPGKADVALGVGGHDIPDTAWRHVTIACPDIYILMAFSRIRDYDHVRRFLTPSIPLREIHIDYGIDLNMRQRYDSDASCFIRHVAFRYADTLVTLSFHQWRFALFPLRRVFELMPQLVRFYYVGRVADEVDLRRMLQILACGVCDRLKHVRLQIQDEESRRDYWQKVIVSVLEEYSNIMELFNINLCINVYKC